VVDGPGSNASTSNERIRQGLQKIATPNIEVSVSSRRTVILIAAIAVGVFAGVALLNYVRGIEDDVYADAQPRQVLIASEDIPEGTPSAQALQMMEVTDIPLSIRPATFIPVDGTDEIAGLVARGEIPKNQIIIRGLFVDPTVVSASFKDQIPSGQVAVTLQVGQIEAVGGYLQPGDEVNLMVVDGGVGCGQAPAAEEDPEAAAIGDVSALDSTGQPLQVLTDEEYCTYSEPARYVFQRLEILAIGARQTLAPGETSNAPITPQGGPITFMVPNEAAQLLASLDTANIHLTLLPEDYVAEQQRALTFSLLEGPTPAEIASCLTPYGTDGFIAGDSVESIADGAAGTVDHFSCETLWEE